jgi:hypothetical protein
MNLRIQVALLKGAHATAFNRIGHHAQHACKSWHLEVDKKYAAKMKGLIQCAKEYGCVEEIWGSHTHLSKVTDSNSTAREAKRQVDVAQIHTNYQRSMSVEELMGVINLNKKVDWNHPTTNNIYSFSLRMAWFFCVSSKCKMVTR